nr:hypothetical protein [Nocardioides marinisabuli]
MQPPPGADRVGDRRQRRTDGLAEAGPGGHQQGQDHQGQRHGDRVGQEARHQRAVVGHVLVVVLGDGPSGTGLGGVRRGVALGGRGPAALGDVGGLVGERGDEVAHGVEAVAVGQPRGRQQPAHLLGRRGGPGPALAPGAAHVAGAADQGEQGGQLVEGLPDRAHQQEAEHPQQRAQHQAHDLEGQGPRAHVDQQREQGGPALLEVRVPPGQRGAPQPAVGGLGVEDDGLGHHQRGVPGGRGAPAEVEVVAEDGEVVVEPAEVLEHAAPHEHPGGVDRQHPAHLVVLALVVLAALETALAPSGAGDGHPDLEQPAQRGPLAQLGAQHVGPGVLLGRRQQLLERRGVGGRVVVQQPDPLDLGPELGQAASHRLRVAGAGRGGHHGPEGGLEQVGALVAAAGVDGHHAVGGPGLGAQRLDHHGQPARTVVTDHEGGDRRRSCPGHDRQGYVAPVAGSEIEGAPVADDRG